MNITQKPTPNYNIGRNGVKVDRIVLHWIVGTLASADSTFKNASSEVSAHYAIEDTKVHQYVQEDSTAWHAGNGAMNQRSIGIEHSAQPGRDASAATLETSAQLIADISKRHNIILSRATVLKHSEVVPTQCPGTIPIDLIIQRANQIIGEGMIKDTDNEFSRWQKLGYQVRGRNMTRDEFRKAAVGKTWLTAIEILSDNDEANSATRWQDVGRIAVKDSWEKQITDLKAQLASGGVDQATKDSINETNSIVKAIRDLLSKIFK